MCGLAGFFLKTPVSEFVAQSVLQTMRQRGPDAEHIVAWDAQFTRCRSASQNALLHARLSVIDVRSEADQPMSNQAGDIWLCYNGEVYDYENHRQALANSGVQFRTHSDSEFILHAYEAWGMDTLLTRLRGMFAFAILDLRQRKIHLARDRMGEKPLVYSWIDGNFAFASLVRSLVPLLPANRRSFSPSAIDAYLAHRYIPAPETIFPDIKRLENGYRLEFDLTTRELTKHRYWYPVAENNSWVEALDTSVRMRTVSDRPLGVLLSGGVDSNLILARLAQQNLTNISTYTAAFPDSAADESAIAKQCADSLGFSNHRVEIPKHIGDDFERIVAAMDQPFADPSCLPTWYLGKEVSRHVKVVLVGDGGDELLAGYKRVYKHLRSAWRRPFRLPLTTAPKMDDKGVSKWKTELSMDWKSAYSLRFSGFTPAERLFLQAKLSLDKISYWRPIEQRETTAALEELLALDLLNYLPEYILQKSDLCLMAHGVEGRGPLLDHRLFQCLLGISNQQRFTHPPKLLFRELIDEKLSATIFNGKKRGFNPPLTSWLKNDLVDRLTGLGARLKDVTNGQLDAVAIDTFATAYLNGKEHFAERLLQLLILDVSLSQLSALGADS